MSSPRASLPLAALYHPSFRDFAGAELVAAWIMQTLQPTHRLVLWALNQPDWKQVDARFGTCLAAAPPAVLTPALPQRLLRAALPNWGRQLRDSLVQQQLQRFHRREAPALWLGTYNEAWLPAPGWLYIHHPECLSPAVASPDWPPWRRRLFAAVHSTSFAVGHRAAVGPAGHRKLANSRWTQEKYAGAGGGPSMLLYPPVPPFDAGLPWNKRQNRVVMLGRWAPAKGLIRAIEIVAAARNTGAADLRLAFAGFWHAPVEQRREIEAAAAPHDWIEWHERPSRAEIMALAGRSRYGLHAMVGEHFGIAVAELATAGCIVIVPDTGGPPEIVSDQRQTYSNVPAAVQKLLTIISSPDIQAELHAKARKSGLRFSPTRFMNEFSRAIATAGSSVP